MLLTYKDFYNKVHKSKNWTQLCNEALVLEYKANARQRDAFMDWAEREGVDEKTAQQLMDRFFDVYPKIKNKDINFYKTKGDEKGVDRLISAIEDAESWETAKEKKKKAKQNAEVKQFDNITAILTFSPEASCFYGSGTTWCTSSKNEVFHWLLHRIIGVEFYLVNSDFPDRHEMSKLSVHINWNKKYATVYNADNKVDFGGERHEYTDMEDLRRFLDNDELYNWIMKEFEITRKDAPKFLPSMIKQLNKVMDKVFDRYHVLGVAIEDYLKEKGDFLNDTEFNIIDNYREGQGKIWFQEFKDWFAKQNYDDIVNMLDYVEKSQVGGGLKVALDDHVIIIEFLKLFFKQKEGFDEEFYSAIPIYFDQDDEAWIEKVVNMLDSEEAFAAYWEDEEDAIDFMDSWYTDHDLDQKPGETRVDVHKRAFEKALLKLSNNYEG